MRLLLSITLSPTQPLVKHNYPPTCRKRRDLANMLIVPGTKWCGKGYLAKRYAEIGGRSKADRCCRHHDKRCPYWIEGFQKKYSLFNWRVNTLMHCKCDERYVHYIWTECFLILQFGSFLLLM